MTDLQPGFFQNIQAVNLVFFASGAQCGTAGETIHSERSSRNPLFYAVQPRKICTSSHAFNTAMKTAVVQASAFTHTALVNSPILRLSLVNITRGNTAKLNCMERMTWL